MRFFFSRDSAGLVICLAAVLIAIQIGPAPRPERTHCEDPAGLLKRMQQPVEDALLHPDESVPKEQILRELEHCANPAVLFNLSMRPVVWNRAATMYEGEYERTEDVFLEDRLIGFLGVAPGMDLEQTAPVRPVRIVYLAVMAFLLLVLVGRRRPLVLFAFGVLIAELVYGMQLAFLVLQAASLAMAGPDRLRRGPFASLLFSGLLVCSLYLLFRVEVNGLTLYAAIAQPAFSIPLLMAFISAAMVLLSGFHWTVLIPVIGIAPFCPAAPLAIGGIYLLGLCLRNGRPIVLVSGVMGASIVLLLLIYGTTWIRMKHMIRSANLSEASIQEQAFQDLETYLEMAGASNYRDLRSFVRQSGLLDSVYDFELVYFNSVGEVVDAYSRGLPDIMELPIDRSMEQVSIGSRERTVVAGVGEFKYGFMGMRLSADVYNIPFLKDNHPYHASLELEPGPDRSMVHIRLPGPFRLLSDMALLALVSMVLLVAFLGVTRTGRTGLFSRTVFSQFSVLTGILVLTAGIVGFQSRSVVRGMVEQDLLSSADMLSQMIQKDQTDLSDNYLKFLQSLAPGEYALYSEGLLLFSTDHLQSPVLLNYRVYDELGRTTESPLIRRGILYIPLNVDRYPFSVLRVRPGASWTPGRTMEAARLLALLLFVLLLGSFGVTGVLTGRTVAPILDLADASREVARGRYELAVSYGEDDEIQVLIDSMKEMARSIRDQRLNLMALLDNVSSAVALVDRTGEVLTANTLFHRLPEAVSGSALQRETGVKQDMVIGDRHYQTASVELENQSRVVIVDDVTDVIRVSRLQVITDMARQISHDIKNPLTPIRLNAEYIESVLQRDMDKAAETVPGAVENILKKTEELRAIAGQFSNLVKAARTKPDQFTTIPIRSFLIGLSGAYPTLAVSVSGRDEKVFADELKLTRVFGNLLENSHAFTGGEGRVDLRIESDNGNVCVHYSDSGRGIPESHVNRVFEPYFSTRDSGTGLGLFIVREFLREMGGSIEAVASDSGARFVIHLKGVDAHAGTDPQ